MLACVMVACSVRRTQINQLSTDETGRTEPRENKTNVLEKME